MSIQRSRQQGYLFFALIIIVFAAVATLLLTEAGKTLLGIGKRVTVTQDSMDKVSDRLVRYVEINGQLPCPANPSLGTTGANAGVPDSATDYLTNPNPTCSVQIGVVPWVALGLTSSEVMDEWGRMISYRVYDGPNGLTQLKGASALDCDTDNGSTVETPPANGTCSGNHNTLYSSFLFQPSYGGTGFKGYVVDDFGSTVNGVAYVLISHGATGLGGYLPSGVQMTMPDGTAGDYPNTQAKPASFKKLAASDASVVAGSSAHFDDLVTYISIDKLMWESRRSARNWPETGAGALDGSGSILPTFTVQNTTDMTTPSSDSTNPHWMSTGPAASGQEFEQSFDAQSMFRGVQFGRASGAYAGCLWWPSRLFLTSGSTRRSLYLYMEFAATTSANDIFPGFTIGFLSGADFPVTPPPNSLCGTTLTDPIAATGASGDSKITALPLPLGLEPGLWVIGNGIPMGTSISSIDSGTGEITLSDLLSGNVGSVQFANAKLIGRDIGWAGGALAGYQNRFSIELDPYQSLSSANPTVLAANDPARPHLAIDSVGVVHGTNAETCTPSNYGAGCNRPALDTFPATTKEASGYSGASTVRIIDSTGIGGVVHGMTVTGAGVADGATVVALLGNTVSLSATNTADISGILTFGAISSNSLMQNGLDVYHSVRAELTPRACTSKTVIGSGTSTITVLDVVDLAAGMGVYGAGIAPGATVVSIVGGTVTLSIANIAAVASSVNFAWPPETQKASVAGTSGENTITVPDSMGIGVGMFALGSGIGTGARVALITDTTITLTTPVVVNGITTNVPARNIASFSNETVTFTNSLSRYATGNLGDLTLNVNQSTGLYQGMPVFGAGVATGATVFSVSGTTVTLSAANTSQVTGGQLTFTNASVLPNTLVKSWTLSNAGCNESSLLCATFRNLNAAFPEYMSNNNQALHSVSCVPAPTPSDALDSVYLGLTSSNVSAVPGINVIFRNLNATNSLSR